jgi:hypothetical protein
MQLNTFVEQLDRAGDIYSFLESIDQSIITPEIATYIVKMNGWALQYIPDELITEEMCWLAVHRSDNPDGDSIRFVPQRHMSYNLCFVAVLCPNQVNTALMDIPDEFKDYNLCLAAVSNPMQQNFYALEFVPEHLKDVALCRVALSANVVMSTREELMRFVPDAIKNEI